MSWAPAIPQTVLEGARALGILGAGDAIDADWFRDPIARINTVLRAPAQRAALLRLIDTLAPPTQTIDGTAWHPVGGRFFITLQPTTDGVTVGLGAELGDGAQLRAHLALVQISSNQASLPAEPLAVTLDLPLGWTRPAHAMALAAVRVDARLGLADRRLTLTLAGLDLDGRGPRDRVIDSAAALGGEAEVVLGLLAEELRGTTGPAGHLLALLGLADALPPLPLARAGGDPTAWRGWLDALVTGGVTAPAPRWLGHLVALAGAVGGAHGSGGTSDPWRARLAALDGSAGVDLTMAVDETAPGARRALFGAVVALSPAAAPVQVEIALALMAVPLAGRGAIAVLPTANLAVRATFPAGTPVRGLSAGLVWRSPPGRLEPALVLDDVTVAGQHYDRIDLSNAGSLTAAAAGALVALLTPLLGPHLGALVGLVAPTGDPTSPRKVDPVALATRPLQAIAAVHRAALLDPVHGWQFLFADLAALLGLPGAATPSGTGTPEDPWRLTLGTAGILRLDVGAWHEGDGALRLGLLAATEPSLWEVQARAALVALDLPATGTPTLALLGGLRIEALLHPPALTAPDPESEESAGLAIAVSAASAGLALQWAPGSAATGSAFVRTLSIDVGGAPIDVPLLQLPMAGSFSAAALGIDDATLNRALVALAARAIRVWGGPAAGALAGLLGVSVPAVGTPLSSALPTLADAAASLASGSLLADPGAAARQFLASMTTGATARLPQLLGALQAQSVGGDPARGGGVRDDPWRASITPELELLAWLSPGGSPERLAAIRARLAAATDFVALTGGALELGPFVPALGAALAERGPGALAGGLMGLARHLSNGDGLVSLPAQTAPDFVAGTTVIGAHGELLAAPAVIAQIGAQIDAWAGGGPRVVLLLSAPFTDRSSWAGVLSAAGVDAGETPHFDLRGAGEGALGTVTATSGYYTADLDFGGASPLGDPAAQIDRLLGRLAALAPTTPVTIVAHSATGVFARAVAVAQPTRLRGLITVAAPLGGAALTPLRDPAIADAVRFLQRLGPLGVGPVDAALRLLVAALDGWRDGTGGAPPTAAPFSLSAFSPPAAAIANGMAGVPALAITARLGQELFGVLRAALVALADAAVATAPTHLEVGLRVGLAVGADVDLRLRADLARVALVSGAPVPSTPAWRVETRAVLRGTDAWLAGMPGATFAAADARVRWAEIGAAITPGGQVTPIARLHQAGWRGPVVDEIALPGPAARALLGAVVFSPADEQPSPRRRLMEALEALGLAARDADGRLALAVDAVDALAADPAEFLATRLGPALAGDRLWQALGTVRDGRLAVGPLEIGVEAAAGASPWILVVRTAAAGLSLGEGATLFATLRLGGATVAAEAELVVGSFRLTWSSATGRLVVAVDEWLEPVVLLPAAPGALSAAVTAVAPRILVSAGLAALLDRELPASVRLGPLDHLLAAPGAAFARPQALGTDTGGAPSTGGIDGSRLAAVVDLFAGLIDLPPAPERGLSLPGGLLLSVTGEPGRADIALATTQPVGSVKMEVATYARLDAARHVTLGGRLAATIPLPGDWPSVGIVFTADEHGFALDVVPPGATTPIHVHPFGGLGPLVGAAETLLPAALDALVSSLAPATGPPVGLLGAALGVASALGIYDPTGGFAAHANDLHDLSTGGLSAVTAARQVALASAAVDLLAHAGLTLPGTFIADGTHVRWTLPLPAAAGGGSAALDVDVGAPALSLGLTGVAPAGGVLNVDLAAAVGAAGIELAANLGLALEGLPSPRLSLRDDAGALSVALVPLGAGTETTLAIALAPELAVHASAGGLRELILGWALPLAARRLLDEFRPRLAQALWTAGPTLGQVLASAELLTTPSGSLTSPLPAPETIVRGLVRILGTTPAALSPTLSVRFVSADNRLGLLLSGHHDLDLDGIRATLIFGEPSIFISDADRGLSVLLFADAPGPVALRPALRLVGCGFGLSGTDGKALVDQGPLHLGGARGYLFGSLALDGGSVSMSEFGAGVELDGVGLPIAQAASGGSNPVVGALLGSGGGTPGDTQPVAPTVNVAVWDRGSGVRVTIDGHDGPLWIPVARSFGPIFVDQVGVVATAAPGLDIVVDGSVRLGGLLVAFDDLTLSIPFAALARPGDWNVDLAGLGVTFAAAGVTLSGALRRTAGHPPSYDGFLLAQVAGRSITAVGSFAEPTDAAGQYPSLFAFAALSVPLGGPPMFYVTGLGGGGGYNRALVPPEKVTDVEDFILVEAIDDTSLATDPTGALSRMATSVPPRRGSAFLAAGVRFTSYVVVHSTVVASVEMGHGVEVDVLGISRMQLPPKGTPLANVELALHARYSTSERMLSVMAQLTDNSWLLDRNCQLTGGFAFCYWFDDGDFVLTLGGYHPDFVKPARYPDVPRLGFNWHVSDRIVVKGECYFALTSSCVMAGGRLEATYDRGSLRAWFTSYANILVSWDPFRYDFAIGISIGASYTMKVCFIKCAHLSFTVSVGADLRLRGPALHGTVTVSLAVASVTFDFGSESSRPNYLPAWPDFAAKYLSGAEPVAVRVERGLLPARASGPPADGSLARPFRVAGELALVTETRMPANQYQVSGGTAVAAPGAASLDIAPLGPDVTGVASVHALVLESRNGTTYTAVPLGGPLRPVSPVMGRVPEATFRFRADDDDVPAARTLPALLGLRLDGHAELHGARPPVRFVDLITSAGRSRPLPYDAPTPEHLAGLDQLGLTAEMLATLSADATTATVGAAARRLLSDEPAAVAVRAAVGLPARGLSGVALAGIARRSAPPMVMPLSTGLARRAPGLGEPPPRAPAPLPPPTLHAPRLRAVLAMPPGPTRTAPPRLATRVSAKLAGDAPRVAAPVLVASATAARLTRKPSASALQPTRAAVAGRSWQTGELGAAVAPAARREARSIEAALGDKGVAIPAGVTQVWDLPAGTTAVQATGDAALRLTFLDRGGAVLADRELTTTKTAVTVKAPAGTATVAATCLGISPVGVKVPAPGAVTSRVAPPGGAIVTGWELSDRAPLIAPSTLLVRGACVRLGRPPVSVATGRNTGPRIVALADMVGGPAAIETQLPPGTRLVLVLLDVLDPTAAEAGDLRLSAVGGTLTGPVQRTDAGRRRALLYQVSGVPKGSTSPLAVSVASATGFAVAGVMGVAGLAADWAERFRAGIPDGLVPDDPLTPTGQVTVRLRTGDKT